MTKKQPFILWFKELGIKNVPQVGGKNAALGEMYRQLVPLGVNIPNGFAITADAYRHFLDKAGLTKAIAATTRKLNTKNIKALQAAGAKIRRMILEAKLPDDLVQEIKKAYGEMGRLYGENPDVAVRSSATAEDLPGASFAGQQETYLNVVGVADLLLSTKKCIASLFTDRAISYRVDKGFSHTEIALSIGVQKMVRSDLGASGVIFTIDTESGFDKVVVVTASYGLGEMVVQGKVTPDEFMVFKPALAEGYKAIIGKELGKKNVKLIYADRGTETVPVSRKDQARLCISDDEALRLAKWSVEIEKHFSKKHHHYQPMDIEWAKDGITGKLFIVQARPETVQSSQDKNVYVQYRLKKTGKTLISGIAVGAKIASGKVNIIKDAKRIADFKKGEVLVTEITDPDWEPIMKIASAIVTDKGGRTSHAAIVSRELGIPCIVGTMRGTRILKTGKPVTVDCSSGATGRVLEGSVPFEVIEHHLHKLPKTRTHVMVNIGSPDEAFDHHRLPAQGVGLGRLEFIIAEHIKIHPNALIDYPRLHKLFPRKATLKRTIRQIDALTRGYDDKTEYYVERLAEGIAKIGATFYPHPVIVRFSDFKTNEYRTLLGGDLYEPEEENPMLGWRGASRYYHPKFKDAFGLECKAMKRVRGTMGLTNVIPMIPFCRTPEEGKQVLDIMAKHGLSRAKDRSLKVYVMCEIPSNILLADQFLKLFDGMSIGSNDLTQLTLGLDRDSSIIAGIANETDPSVHKLIAEVIAKCRARAKYSGLCGQAPSDHPAFLRFLVDQKISSISLNPDTVVRGIVRVAEEERRARRRAH